MGQYRGGTIQRWWMVGRVDKIFNDRPATLSSRLPRPLRRIRVKRLVSNELPLFCTQPARYFGSYRQAQCLANWSLDAPITGDWEGRQPAKKAPRTVVFTDPPTQYPRPVFPLFSTKCSRTGGPVHLLRRHPHPPPYHRQHLRPRLQIQTQLHLRESGTEAPRSILQCSGNEQGPSSSWPNQGRAENRGGLRLSRHLCRRRGWRNSDPASSRVCMLVLGLGGTRECNL
jgi:hypothetical protein